ncbi:MAG: hypothetical protein ABIJ31_14690 [Pseudomonadota bacterium]
MNKCRRPLIIDVEASGFGQHSYPIEIGLALAENERYCSLIHPSDTWTYWDDNAQKIHNITRKILLKNGKPVCEVAQELNATLGRATVYSDCWGVDKPWVTKLFYQAGIVQSFHISPLEMILSEQQMAIWHVTKDRIIKTYDLKRHRASTDAYVIQETYMQSYSLTKN